MIITDPITWLINRVELNLPFFNLRFNDGEQILIFKVMPEGYEMSDMTRVFHAQGDALEKMVREMASTNADAGTSHPDGLLLGCSWWCEPDALCERFVGLLESLGMLQTHNWCHPHYFLDAVQDGSIFRLIDVLRKSGKVVLVTNDHLSDACYCLGAEFVTAPRANSWLARDRIYDECEWFARDGATFVWCAGGGVKPLAWQLFRAFPRTSHLDFGHLFDGVFGITERMWLRDKSSPWYQSYHGAFVPYVRRFIP